MPTPKTFEQYASGLSNVSHETGPTLNLSLSHFALSKIVEIDFNKKIVFAIKEGDVEDRAYRYDYLVMSNVMKGLVYPRFKNVCTPVIDYHHSFEFSREVMRKKGIEKVVFVEEAGQVKDPQGRQHFKSIYEGLSQNVADI